MSSAQKLKARLRAKAKEGEGGLVADSAKKQASRLQTFWRGLSIDERKAFLREQAVWSVDGITQQIANFIRVPDDAAALIVEEGLEALQDRLAAPGLPDSCPTHKKGRIPLRPEPQKVAGLLQFYIAVVLTGPGHGNQKSNVLPAPLVDAGECGYTISFSELALFRCSDVSNSVRGPFFSFGGDEETMQVASSIDGSRPISTAGKAHASVRLIMAPMDACETWSDCFDMPPGGRVLIHWDFDAEEVWAARHGIGTGNRGKSKVVCGPAFYLMDLSSEGVFDCHGFVDRKVAGGQSMTIRCEVGRAEKDRRFYLVDTLQVQLSWDIIALCFALPMIHPGDPGLHACQHYKEGDSKSICSLCRLVRLSREDKPGLGLPTGAPALDGPAAAASAQPAAVPPVLVVDEEGRMFAAEQWAEFGTVPALSEEQQVLLPHRDLSSMARDRAIELLSSKHAPPAAAAPAPSPPQRPALPAPDLEMGGQAPETDGPTPNALPSPGPSSPAAAGDAQALQQPQQSQALAAGGQGAGEGEKDGPQCYGEVLRAYADTNALLRKDRRVAMDVEAQLRGIERGAPRGAEASPIQEPINLIDPGHIFSYRFTGDAMTFWAGGYMPLGERGMLFSSEFRLLTSLFMLTRMMGERPSGNASTGICKKRIQKALEMYQKVLTEVLEKLETAEFQLAIPTGPPRKRALEEGEGFPGAAIHELLRRHIALQSSIFYEHNPTQIANLLLQHHGEGTDVIEYLQKCRLWIDAQLRIREGELRAQELRLKLLHKMLEADERSKVEGAVLGVVTHAWYQYFVNALKLQWQAQQEKIASALLAEPAPEAPPRDRDSPLPGAAVQPAAAPGAPGAALPANKAEKRRRKKDEAAAAAAAGDEAGEGDDRAASGSGANEELERRVAELEEALRGQKTAAREAQQRAAETEERAAQERARVEALQRQLAELQTRERQANESLKASRETSAGLQKRLAEERKRTGELEERAKKEQRRAAEAEAALAERKAEAQRLRAENGLLRGRSGPPPPSPPPTGSSPSPRPPRPLHHPRPRLEHPAPAPPSRLLLLLLGLRPGPRAGRSPEGAPAAPSPPPAFSSSLSSAAAPFIPPSRVSGLPAPHPAGPSSPPHRPRPYPQPRPRSGPRRGHLPGGPRSSAPAGDARPSTSSPASSPAAVPRPSQPPPSPLSAPAHPGQPPPLPPQQQQQQQQQQQGVIPGGPMPPQHVYIPPGGPPGGHYGMPPLATPAPGPQYAYAGQGYAPPYVQYVQAPQYYYSAAPPGGPPPRGPAPGGHPHGGAPGWTPGSPNPRRGAPYGQQPQQQQQQQPFNGPGGTPYPPMQQQQQGAVQYGARGGPAGGVVPGGYGQQGVLYQYVDGTGNYYYVSPVQAQAASMIQQQHVQGHHTGPPPPPHPSGFPQQQPPLAPAPPQQQLQQQQQQQPQQQPPSKPGEHQQAPQPAKQAQEPPAKAEKANGEAEGLAHAHAEGPSAPAASASGPGGDKQPERGAASPAGAAEGQGAQQQQAASGPSSPSAHAHPHPHPQRPAPAQARSQPAASPPPQAEASSSSSKAPAAAAPEAGPAAPGAPGAEAAASSSSSAAAAAEAAGPLRGMDIPAELVERFEELAASNTKQERETCAVLLGRQTGAGRLSVSALLVPKQTCAPDRCETAEDTEVETLAIAEKHDLQVMGCIHTHPSQGCFLSSIDMHNLLGYQLQLREAVSIVVAPKHEKRVGLFRLTDKGTEIIRACKLADFHEHRGVPDSAIYEDCPHITLTPGAPGRAPLAVFDLR
eukprot:tig00021127_g18732.t1